MSNASLVVDNKKFAWVTRINNSSCKKGNLITLSVLTHSLIFAELQIILTSHCFWLLYKIICVMSYTNQKEETIFSKYIFMLKPKQFFIIIYSNVCGKRVYPHKANNNILLRYRKNQESQFSVPWSNLRWPN